MKAPEAVSLAAALLWMSAAIAARDGKPYDAQLGALKGIVSTGEYASNFNYGDLRAWVEKNIEPPDMAAFWIAVARVCEGTEKPDSLDQFPRWRDAKPLPLEEGLRAIAPE